LLGTGKKENGRGHGEERGGGELRKGHTLDKGWRKAPGGEIPIGIREEKKRSLGLPSGIRVD